MTDEECAKIPEGALISWGSNFDVFSYWLVTKNTPQQYNVLLLEVYQDGTPLKPPRPGVLNYASFRPSVIGAMATVISERTPNGTYVDGWW